MHPNAAVVAQVFAAFADRDLATARSLVAEDVRWHISGTHAYAGTHHGVDAFIGLLEAIGGSAEVENAPHAVLADDDHVVVLASQTYRRESRTVDVQMLYVIHIADGRLTEGWVTPFEQAAYDAFWK